MGSFIRFRQKQDTYLLIVLVQRYQNFRKFSGTYVTKEAGKYQNLLTGVKIIFKNS